MATSDKLPESEPGFGGELRQRPHVASVGLMLIGLAIFALSGLRSDLGEGFGLMAYAAFVLALSGGTWLVTRWREGAGRWAALAALTALGYTSWRWVTPEGSLLFAALPVALAAALISLRAAVLMAVIQTVGVLILLPQPSLALHASAIASIWALLATMYLIYLPVHRISHWAWEYFARARDLLQEARDRRLTLESALKNLEDANSQLLRLNALAQGLRQAAEDARTAKEQFVANVSHELRTPLNMITGFTDMILQAPETYGDSLPATLLADLAVIQRNAEHLAALIDDVLDLSRIEADQMALLKERVNYEAVVNAAATAVRPLYRSKNLFLEIDLPPHLPEVFCDRTRITEVILNLLSNAGRYTDEGGARLRVTTAENSMVTEISDTGPGIAEGDLSRLFQPFQQLDGTIRRRHGGTGLGLSISRRFIQLHGGDISVKSEPGRGTTFTFRIPIRPTTPSGDDFARWVDPDWVFHQRVQPRTPTLGRACPRYIVVERGNALSHLVNRYLADVELVQAKTLEEAAPLTATPATALLVNCDNVSECLRELRASPHLPEGIPVFVCSLPDAEDESSRLGAAIRLVKPISQDALLQALDELGIHTGTVLIVDDEPDALQLFSRMLTSLDRGFRVLRAGDGLEALTLTKAHHPDVVLLDLVMPTLDGFAFLEALRELSELPPTPVIVISATDPQGHPIVSDALGVAKSGGISSQQLLRSIEAFTRIYSVMRLSEDQGPPEARNG
jgi:signal transduction histidine kinase/CheY-like chemotaxis protein